MDQQIIPGSKLLRVSSHQDGEPYFGRSGFNRFDDPEVPPEYGTCYVAESLSVAIAETLIHSVAPVDGEFLVSLHKVSALWVHQMSSTDSLSLVEFSGPLLKRLGISSSDLSDPTDYSHAQNWSRRIYEHSEEIDGVEYMSRQLNDRRAVVLYDRAKDKRGLTVAKSQRLVEHEGFVQVLDELHIRIE